MRRNGTSEIPPRLELECLKVLWRLGQGNVKDVRRELIASRNLAYTTVMTVLDRLARKGCVVRRKVGRSFLYSPVLNRDSLCRLAIRDLVDSFFEGSEDALLRYLRSGETSTAAAHEVHLDTALL
ncbi:MAG: BlaI/MecI/CopY family transcriptional regulator [Acidobacteriia bacterium]|nr:BlaI/MecI/CopY family transcriptional regulator [Terriglobia bacterium]